MNRTTGVFVGLALLSLAGAFAMAPKDLPPATFEDTGELLFPGFSDPTLATSLLVVMWSEEEANVQRFSVELKDGQWKIPSHHDYPADGTERMGKAAASFIDVKRDIYYGDKLEDHARFGVLDPEDEKGEAGEKGKRFAIKDASGTPLVDIIVGKKVPEKGDFYYVRFPDQKRVYGSRLNIDISTKFTDWIERDLLRMESDDVVEVIYDPYQVDERRGRIVDSQPMIFVKGSAGQSGDGTWQLGPKTKAPRGKKLEDYKIGQLVSSVDRLNIVGIRPRPELLTLQALQSKGFFVTTGGGGQRLFGNEGELLVRTKDGIIYTLYFGEVTFDSGLALTAGKAAEASDSSKEDGDKGQSANRYLFVNVRYEPSADTVTDKSKEEAVNKQKAKVQALQKRFGEWFYVISDSSFKSIHKKRSELFADAK